MVHKFAVELQAKRHMGVQHAALQYMADMWKRSSQPVVSNAWRLGRASNVPPPATAESRQRVQQREGVQGDLLDTPGDIHVDRVACVTVECMDGVASIVSQMLVASSAGSQWNIIHDAMQIFIACRVCLTSLHLEWMQMFTAQRKGCQLQRCSAEIWSAQPFA